MCNKKNWEYAKIMLHLEVTHFADRAPMFFLAVIIM